MEQSEAELTQVRETRLALEKRVSLLRPERLDPDLLDEVARETLGFSRTDEFVVRLNH